MSKRNRKHGGKPSPRPAYHRAAAPYALGEKASKVGMWIVARNEANGAAPIKRRIVTESEMVAVFGPARDGWDWPTETIWTYTEDDPPFGEGFYDRRLAQSMCVPKATAV